MRFAVIEILNMSKLMVFGDIPQMNRPKMSVLSHHSSAVRDPSFGKGLETQCFQSSRSTRVPNHPTEIIFHEKIRASILLQFRNPNPKYENRF